MSPPEAQSQPTPEIVVYGPAEAPFVEKVVRALALKKLTHRVVEPEGPEDYRRWNPETGLLPVMQLDDRPRRRRLRERDGHAYAAAAPVSCSTRRMYSRSFGCRASSL